MNELFQFEKEYSVNVYETDPDGILSLSSLFNYMQDIASDHAEKLGFGRDDLMKHNWFWALSRMYAEIELWPKWKDTIILKTWPNGTDKLFALRNYEVKFPDGRIIARGTSSWLVLDSATRRIQRPESALSHFKRNFDPQESPLRYAGKLEPPEPAAVVSEPFRVRVSDLDINQHTNNVRYLQWVNDTYSLDFAMKNSPKSVEINYLSESLFNEEIFIMTSEEKGNGGIFSHSIFRKNDEKELCRVKIGWKHKHLFRIKPKMKRHYKSLTSISLLIVLLVPATFNSCRTAKPTVDTKDLSYLYNPTKNSFNPGFHVSLQSENNAIVTVRFASSELFFSEANPEGLPTAGIIVSIKLFRIDQARTLIDTISYNLNIIRDANKREYLYNVPLKVESGNKYLAELKVLDRLRMLVNQSFVSFNTLSPINKYNFISIGYFNKNQLFSQVLRVDEYISLQYLRGPIDSLYISYFRPFSSVPDPPSMMLPQKSLDYDPDRIAALAYSDTLPIMLPRKGVFLCSVDRKMRDGYTLYNFGQSYPNMTTPEEMIEPLIYLAQQFELDQMKASARPKVALDDFWVKCGGNIERARELIRIYYTRAVYANLYFTSFTEGWRTERGMIYVIYGPPDKVYKNQEGETWGYRKPVIKSSWGGRYKVKEEYLFFNFKHRDNIFSDNDYYLSRNETLITYWDQAILSWRKGIVFRLDNPEGI